MADSTSCGERDVACRIGNRNRTSARNVSGVVAAASRLAKNAVVISKGLGVWKTDTLAKLDKKLTFTSRDLRTNCDVQHSQAKIV